MFTTNICDVFIYLFYFFQLDTPPLKCKWELFISHENKLLQITDESQLLLKSD